MEECLGFGPDGEGEHAFLHVEKRGQNTAWVAQQLARFAGVRPMCVGYAGLKDRHAVTRQYFSVHLPGRPSPDWSKLDVDGVKVLAADRHGRKIQRGALRGNRFRIVARGVEGDREAIGGRVAAIRASGVPNYFGEQRFGRGEGNLEQAERLFRGELGRVPRSKRGLYLSAARARLFNMVLARRVTGGSWNRALEGDVFALAGARAVFGPEPLSGEIRERLNAMDIHPTGPLWGRGELPTAGVSRELEEAELSGETLFREGLERAGMKQERRALRLVVADLEHSMEGDALVLEFCLERGAFATVVLRELLEAAG